MSQVRAAVNKKIKMERNFLCHICGKTFLRRQDMTTHIRIDEGYRYICRIDMCYKFFKRKHHFLQHRLSHTGERPYVCHVCGDAFRYKTNLNRHCKRHDEGRQPFPRERNIKPYVCEVCQVGFVRKENLTSHSRIHTDDKAFRCAHCAFRTPWKYNLKKHLVKCFKTRGVDAEFD